MGMGVGVEPHYYPRRFTRTAALTTVAESVFTGKARFSHCTVHNQAGAARTITFRGLSNGTVVLTIRLATNVTLTIPGWQVDSNGLEVLTNNATGTQTITFYHTPGSLGAS